MLFTVHSDLATGEKDFFEMNPGAQAIEEFNKCSSRQMFTVCLIADRDYDSPLRTLPERIRREKAVLIAGYPREGNRPDKNARNIIDGKVKSVESAIQKYQEIQFDEDKAMLFALNAQIQEAMDTMAANKEELAKVVKVTTNKKTGETTKMEYVDAKMLNVLKTTAVNLGAKLPALKDARTKLLENMKIASPLENITTYSSQDVLASVDDDDDLLDGEGSTLDAFNEKQFKQKENAD